jgi:hypothetical protein
MEVIKKEFQQGPVSAEHKVTIKTSLHEAEELEKAIQIIRKFKVVTCNAITQVPAVQYTEDNVEDDEYDDGTFMSYKYDILKDGQSASVVVTLCAGMVG